MNLTNTQDLKQFIQNLPKTDLHCHLDGSLRAETVLDIARIENVDLGVSNLDALKKKLVCGDKVTDLPQFLQAFGLTCSVLQTKEAIERVAFELAEDCFFENVTYLEVRFSPLLMLEKGLSWEEAVRAVSMGLKKAERQYPIQTGIIICALRVDDPSLNAKLAYESTKWVQHGVIGFDLAHAEAGNPAKKHAEAFKIAKAGGLQLTVHAGEAWGPSSIHQAIDACDAQRIGHGLTLIEDPLLMEKMKSEKIFVECCPSSNVQISLIPDFKNHPIKKYILNDMPVTLNTDNRLLTGIRVSDEYVRCAEHLDMKKDQLITLARNGFEAAFVDESSKKDLLKNFELKLATLLK